MNLDSIFNVVKAEPTHKEISSMSDKELEEFDDHCATKYNQLFATVRELRQQFEKVFHRYGDLDVRLNEKPREPGFTHIRHMHTSWYVRTGSNAHDQLSSIREKLTVYEANLEKYIRRLTATEKERNIRKPD